MPMTLDDGAGNVVDLNESLEWVDEYEWSDVKQDIKPTLGGGLVISESTVVAGRPITLVSGSDVWTTKQTIDELMTLVNTVDKTYTLTLPDTRTFNVVFNRENGSPLTATPIFRQNIKGNDHEFELTLRLMEI